MKKIFTLIIFAITLNLGFAQVSSLKPTLVVWKADGTTYALRRALYGVNQPSALKLEVYIKASDVSKYKNLKLEFRWFYYLSTRRKFISSQIVPLSKAQKLSGGILKFTSTLNTVQPGWWEVQVVNTTDRRFLSFAGKTKFQIMVRRPIYATR